MSMPNRTTIIVSMALIKLLLPAMAAAQDSDLPMYLETPEGEKPRVVITTDPELDDSNSLVRYLLYSTDFRTEGLIYSSSQFHWAGDGQGTTFAVPGREYTRFGLDLCPCTSWRWSHEERFIDDALYAYSLAYPNLRVHDPDYPSPVDLKSTVRWGNVQFDGDISQDTPGSDLIRSLLLDNEEAPIYLHAWGGQSTIARALKSIEEEFSGTPEWPEIRAKVIRKAVIHPSGDQDDTYATYIQPHWPEIRYWELTGGVGISYGSQDRVSLEDARYLRADWIGANIANAGPLGALIRTWGDGKQMVERDIFDYFGIAGTAEELRSQGYVVWTPPQPQGDYIGEGDTGTFLNLIDNGLRGYRGDSFGGWGGYLRSAPTNTQPSGFSQSLDELEANTSNPDGPPQPRRAQTHRFFESVQLDWAGRFRWAVTPEYTDANHNPQIELNGPSDIVATAGEAISLSANPSDPDGDDVTLHWWRWADADGYGSDVQLRPTGNQLTFIIPAHARAGDTLQIVAEATDNGSPTLTSYAKVVVTVID